VGLHVESTHLPPNEEMHALVVLAVVAAWVPGYEAGVLRASKSPLSAEVDATLAARAEVAKFGPGNCIGTWRNEDGHCEVETKCKEHDISKYPVKFICMDDGGEKVRHVFAAGSFDPEEQFDTLIECKKCLAEKQETIEIISDDPPAGKKKKGGKKEEKPDEEQLGGAPLKELRNEVKQLEAFMMNTSAILQKLNAKVYSAEWKPPADVKKPSENKDKKADKKAAAKDGAAAASLVHHSSAHHHRERSAQVVEPLRIQAEASAVKKLHQRRIEEDDSEPEDVQRPRKAVQIQDRKTEAMSSLAGALKVAEERDDEFPAHRPARSPMVLSMPHFKQRQPKKKLVVDLVGSDDADDEDGDEDGDDEAIPQSADDFEREEEGIAAVQESQDSD